MQRHTHTHVYTQTHQAAQSSIESLQAEVRELQATGAELASARKAMEVLQAEVGGDAVARGRMQALFARDQGVELSWSVRAKPRKFHHYRYGLHSIYE